MSESSCECDVCNCITIINMNYICNDCLELIKKKAKRRGRVEELREIKKWIEKQSYISFDRFSNKKEMEYVTSYEVCELILKEFERRLLELEKGELK